MNSLIKGWCSLFIIFLLTSVEAWSLPVLEVDSDGSVVNVTKTSDLSKYNKSNTTYVIQTLIDLKNGQWKVPSNSTLFFMGGGIRNGKLVFNQTLLDGTVRFEDVSLTGTCDNDELYLSWFRDDITGDYSPKLQALHDIAKMQAIIKIGATRYLINNPVGISKAITIKGSSTRTYNNLGEDSFASTLYTTKDNNILTISARMVAVESLNFIGVSSGFEKNKVRSGSKSLVKFLWTSSCKVRDCNFIQSHIGLELVHSGIATIENNNIAQCNVGIVADHSGDCNYINNYINTCDCNGTIDIEDDNVTSLNGIGILFKPGSGNSNVIGGKIEWNNKGIVNTGASGVTITGVQFDYNKSGHIFYYQGVMQYDSGINANTIVGCHFLGTPGKQHIYIRYMTTTKINVTGNIFSCTGRGASDNNKDAVVGPDNVFSIYERHIDDRYKNECVISYGSNTCLNMKKLCSVKLQINDMKDSNLVRILNSENSLPTEGSFTVISSDNK